MFRLLALSLLLASCATNSAASSNVTPSAATTSPELKRSGEATIGDKTTCLVTDEVFTVAADSEKYVYEGKTYYFCCDGCVDDFKKDPRKYIAKIK